MRLGDSPVPRGREDDGAVGDLGGAVPGSRSCWVLVDAADGDAAAAHARAHLDWERPLLSHEPSSARPTRSLA